MSIYRCPHCKHLGEHPAPAGAGRCARCGGETKFYDAVHFINQILARYTAALRELDALREESADGVPPPQNGINPLNHIKFSDTDTLTSAAQHQALNEWFARKNIRAEFDYGAVDMSGYYDEAAAAIGKYHDVFQDIIGKIAWAYRKQHVSVNFDLNKYNQKNTQNICRICREFYSHTLFARYRYQKPEKLLNLQLQNAAPVRQFFQGGWLEWFALGVLLEQAAQRGKQYGFSCARSAKIRFDNQDLHELDVVFLAAGREPLVIECKSGEYRRELDKYLNLRKRLGIAADRFLLLVTDIDGKQAKSLRAMYDLVFVTPQTLPAYLREVM